MSVKYSVVIPVKNEEGNLAQLVSELESVMESLRTPWELICIDDGSTDATLSILQKIASGKPYMRIISFDRNYGQSSAFDAGFRHAKGEKIITLDGDRQNDPADIPRLIEALEDNDMVCGYRLRRDDPWLKKIISFFANTVRSRFCRDGVRDTGCSLKIYRRTCVDKIKMYQGMHRFLPALFVIEGFSVKQIPVNHRKRTAGSTKYNLFNRSLNTVADMLAVRWMYKRRLNYKISQITEQ